MARVVKTGAEVMGGGEGGGDGAEVMGVARGAALQVVKQVRVGEAALAAAASSQTMAPEVRAAPLARRHRRQGRRQGSSAREGR